jgi:hypothetical protein
MLYPLELRARVLIPLYLRSRARQLTTQSQNSCSFAHRTLRKSHRIKGLLGHGLRVRVACAADISVREYALARGKRSTEGVSCEATPLAEEGATYRQWVRLNSDIAQTAV